MWKIVFLYHSWCPSEWVPPLNDLVNPLRGPRLKPKKGQKLSKCVFYFILMRLKAEIRISAGSPFSVLEMFFICVWRTRPWFKSQEKNQKKFIFNPILMKPKNTSKPKRHLHSQNVPHWRSEVSGSNSKMGNISNNSLYFILMKLKTKGHITAKIPLPPLNKFVIGV